MLPACISVVSDAGWGRPLNSIRELTKKNLSSLGIGVLGYLKSLRIQKSPHRTAIVILQVQL
ncbi:hypothetical protein Pla110_02280 [Polystyrenella longa]|uniref:Uncharacterized protein n=1 Tax=Polystyrenella longa TaxID=2528007 RepID=A0A518CH77_9PLAN|nr:hypothetical protein Pla110_02280 [Polystyrenella longa]